MKIVRLTKELVDKVLLAVPFVNRQYVAYKIRKKGKLPKSHGWVPIEMSSIDKAISDHAVVVRDKNKLVLDIVYCHQRYLTTADEYFRFSFDSVNTTHSLRKQYLSENMMNYLLIKHVGIECCDELEDKYGLYLKLKPFYKREICKIETEKDYDKYLEFISRHESYFVKPNSASCGRGCNKVCNLQPHTYTQAADDSEFKKLLMDKGCILEELIDQDDALKQWNPTSVQTIRLNTILTSKGFYVFPAVIRIGKENAVVDNATLGGYVAAIDEKTGAIITKATSYRGEAYGNCEKMKGWHVPEWDTMLDMARKIQESMPHQKFVGWDFAYAKNGWCLVEANWGVIIAQFGIGKGVRKEFERRIREK